MCVSDGKAARMGGQTRRLRCLSLRTWVALVCCAWLVVFSRTGLAQAQVDAASAAGRRCRSRCSSVRARTSASTPAIWRRSAARQGGAEAHQRGRRHPAPAASSCRSSTTSATPQQTVANVKAGARRPAHRRHDRPGQLDRAKAAFDALGTDIGASGIPFLSDITVNSIFEKHAQRLHDAGLAGRRAPAGDGRSSSRRATSGGRPSSASRTRCSARVSATG